MINLTNNNKCILVYGLTNAELVELTKRKIKYILINSNMLDMKIEDILSGKKPSNLNNECINEKVILFNGYQDNKLQKAIKEIRSFTKGGILAVVTDTSKEWSFKYLLNHLMEERSWFESQN